ncbi:hypothetical protein QJ856_gp0194 [Tupanvirus deep ocean]|uniref:Uncharacterized protein n=2 Tax=Tupanvirus TaxID=2094720 RepID=A0AC62A9Z6_9VIRU|nr:hypothetical protein QJ856_gp0194 [Tupanvirus deep ocean]QKU34534.1 hypothetical protein [Tupanvirus deep ocean]
MSQQAPSSISNRPKNLTSAYVFCANENNVCDPGPGQFSVAYASVNGKINYRNVNNEAVICNETYFGDPDPSIPKTCWYTKIPSDITFTNGIPNGFNYCTKEGDTCILSNTRLGDILYGANGNYNYANSVNVKCDSQTLGDPYPNTTKYCYYRKLNYHNPNLNKTNDAELSRMTHFNPNIVHHDTNKPMRNNFFIILLVVFLITVVFVAGFFIWSYLSNDTQKSSTLMGKQTMKSTKITTTTNKLTPPAISNIDFDAPNA